MRPERTDCRRGRADFWLKRVSLTRQISGTIGQILGLIGQILGLRRQISCLRWQISGLRWQISGLRGPMVRGRMDKRTNEWKNKSPHVFCRTWSPSEPLPRKAQKKAHSLSPKKKSQQCYVVTVTSDSPRLKSVNVFIQPLINFDRIPTRCD